MTITIGARPWCLATLGTLLLFSTLSAAHAQDPNHILSFDQLSSSEATAEISCVLDNSNGDEISSAWFRVNHDPASMEVLAAELGSGLQTVGNGGPAWFVNIDIYPDGVDFDFLTHTHPYIDGNHIDPTPSSELLRIDYGALSGGDHELTYGEQSDPPHYFNVTSPNNLLYTPTTLAHDVVFEAMFQRGLCNTDSVLNIADPITLANALFATGESVPCMDSCDANDDGEVDIADIVTLFNWLFATGQALPEPHLLCAFDPTPDSLTCESPPCP